ncbi:metallophosphoesterase family protein [Chryseobacterium mucoviscidosis]|uniref:metallophosphoesterase family protein n=1 Tax=Chryseobacterium mucoviscidosis TaxID=1945581 RepID=UPI0031D4004A
MRIIHLSDIHLSKENIENFRLYYRGALINELRHKNSEIDIDLIIISGDLVDKGGASLKMVTPYEDFENPFDIFEIEFIEPLCNEIGIKKEKVLFIPGNHDIEQNKIDEVKEAGIKALLKSPQDVDRLCGKYLKNFQGLNFERLDAFLEFEQRFHNKDEDQHYEFSTLESKVIYDYNSRKVGIALINDSWRCASGRVENHFVGSHQFHRSIQFFEKYGTELNIAVMHHPLECYNPEEKNEIENLLHFKKFEMLLLGHEHNKHFRGSDFGNDQKILFSRGRSAFDKPHEKESKYISGYAIIDIDFSNKNIKYNYKIYDEGSSKFYDDVLGGDAVRTYKYGIAEEVKEKFNMKEKDFFMGIDKSQFKNNPGNE